MQYALVTFQQKLGKEESFTYAVPSELQAKVQIGQSVTVPFRNKEIKGLIWELHNETPPFKTKQIIEINDFTPLLNKVQVALAKWTTEYYFAPLSAALKLLIPKRVFQQKPPKSNKQNHEQIIRTKTLDLSSEQQHAIDTIQNSKESNFLIHGITGSGKTEIYCRLAATTIAQQKQALILVPEIALTPQTIDYFQKNLGEKATIINSHLSETDRYRNWQAIRSNEAKLIIGSRSAIFSPFQNLGLIIVDEEHESSYKQENTPRYHTHRVLEEIQSLTPECKIVFGSATPSIETAEKLSTTTIKLTERIGTSTLPPVQIVDLREEFKKGNQSIFSEDLQTEITNTLANKGQIILFLNRRGSSSSVVCRDCGEKETCRQCETTLTHHQNHHGGTLICHHCGLITTPPTICKHCQSPNIRYFGIGTQRIEEEIQKLFPEAKTLRADKDTTGGKESFKQIYNAFKKQEASILIGTQMIAKGLHLPNVRLVGVILADIGLNIPNFRANEKIFQLLTQVAGRAGRGENLGKVIIQTYNPENFALTCAQNHDYQNFFTYERTQRQLLKNPPFGRLATLQLAAKTIAEAKKQTEEIVDRLYHFARQNEKALQLEITSYPSFIPKFRGQYRFNILIKNKTTDNTISEILAKLLKEDIIKTTFKIDIDPITL